MIVLVHLVSLVVAGLALVHLFQETLLLVDRIVQFGKGVGQFPAHDEQLEAFDKVRVVLAFFRKRRDVRGVVGDKGRLDELGLDKDLEDLVQQFAQRLPARDPGAELLCILARFIGVSQNIRRYAGLAERVEIGDPFPGRRPD